MAEGDGTRPTPRPHPLIRLNRTLHNFGQYDEVKNTIEFGCCCDTEEDAIKTLLHELAHHDTWMFLTRREIQISAMPDHTERFAEYLNWIPEKLRIDAESSFSF